MFPWRFLVKSCFSISSVSLIQRYFCNPQLMNNNFLYKLNICMFCWGILKTSFLKLFHWRTDERGNQYMWSSGYLNDKCLIQASSYEMVIQNIRRHKHFPTPILLILLKNKHMNSTKTVHLVGTDKKWVS